ncbi:MAG: type II toxin-antitoxin system VapC family toxin [Chloroflexi bacterium]|nr:type II toxin-antitoxin system VapC family toxin [Chloroflexota bacterium]
MNGYVVVDSSVVVKLLVNEVFTDKADALARTWARSGTLPVAPHFMMDESANAIFRRVVLGQLSLDDAIRLTNILASSEIELYSPTVSYARALDLAHQLQQNVIYDAHYLALAELMDCDMWTADERFFRAARQSFDRVKWLGNFNQP